MKKIITIILLLTVWGSYAQNRSDTIHVTHYDIHLTDINFTAHTIGGFTDLTIVTKVPNLSQYVLDLQNLTVDSVFVDGLTAVFQQQGTHLLVNHASQQGDTALVQVHYHGTPVTDSRYGGFYFSGEYCYNMGVAFNYLPHNFGRCWYPCIDEFTDKSSYTFHINTTANKMAVCNGMLTGTDTLADGKLLWTWELEEPIPTYLASVAVGEYRLYADTFHGVEADIPIHIYAQPNTINKVAGSFVHLKSILQMYEAMYGPYRWPRVGYVAVNFSSGAMEHATNIAYPNLAINGNTENELLYAHELNHLWFGDLITCSRAEEMWINEGFASYSEALTSGLVHNTATTNAYLDYIRDMRNDLLFNLEKEDGGMYALDAVPLEVTYGSHSYNKGAVVIHSIRQYMGDSLFFGGMQSLLSQNAYSNVTSAQLFNHLAQTSGLPMMDFYEGWVHQPGFLHFSIDSIVPLGGTQYRVFLHQRLFGAEHFANNNKIDLTFVSQDRTMYTIPDVIFSGEFATLDVTIPFTPAFGMVDYYEKMSDATIDYTTTLTASDTWSPNKSNFSITLDNYEDSALVRIEHNFVDPGQVGDLPEGIYQRSSNHYWTVNIASNVQPQGKLRFRCQRGSGSIDYELTQSYTTINLKLLYRPSNSQPWQVVRATHSGSPNNGQLTIETIAPGQYCIAVGDASVGLSDHESESDIYLFPNPATSQLSILMPETVKSVKASITDTSGKVVKVAKLVSGKNNINISDLPSGIYFIRCNTSSIRSTHTFVKE